MQMLFIRDFSGFAGGHLKVFHYLRHTDMSGLVDPVLYQTPRSRNVPDNIFRQYEGETIAELRAFPAYFVAGEDWFILDQAEINPGPSFVINLVQGFRHADPGHPLFSCLERPALRICVSPAVADAIRPHANGDVIVIENGTDLQETTLSPVGVDRIMIAGLKNRETARELATRLERVADIDLLVDPLPRDAFLTRIVQASICVLLPLAREGFFLPALEAMALGRGIITQDCGGNLCFCRSEANCLIAEHNVPSLVGAAQRLLDDPELLSRIIAGGLATAAQRSMEAERAMYQDVLARQFAAAP